MNTNKDPHRGVEHVAYAPDEVYEDGDPAYILTTYGCGCCSNREHVTADEAREAALSLVARLKAAAAEVEEFIAALDAREGASK